METGHRSSLWWLKLCMCFKGIFITKLHVRCSHIQVHVGSYRDLFMSILPDSNSGSMFNTRITGMDNAVRVFKIKGN